MGSMFEEVCMGNRRNIGLMTKDGAGGFDENFFAGENFQKTSKTKVESMNQFLALNFLIR